MGEIKSPINGKINAPRGAEAQLVTGRSLDFCASGIAITTRIPADNKHTIKTVYQCIFLSTTPAVKRPIAVLAAKMLAIWILSVVGSRSTLLLNVGSQLIMLCSIKT